MQYPRWQEEDDLKALIEETFNLCDTSKDEIFWLIAFIRNMLNIPNRNTKYCSENFKINQWTLQLFPIIESYKKHWKHSNYKG